MKIIYESDVGIALDFTEVLAARAITKVDIQEAVFMVKRHSHDEDASALLDLRLGDGLQWVADKDVLVAKIAINKWGNLEPGKIYSFGVGFKVVGSLRFIEPVLADNVFHVTQDFIRS